MLLDEVVRRVARIVIAVGAAGLSACGVVDPQDEFCNAGFRFPPSFAGPDITLCPGCTVTENRAAVDGKGGTATVYRFDPVGGQVSYQATTTGHAFSAGSVAGAYLHFPLSASGGYANPGVTITTYDGGELQDTFEYAAGVVGNIEGAGSDYFYGGKTTHRFGEVHVEITLSGALNGEEVRLYEVCGDF